MHALVSNDREFLGTRRDKDQDGVALAGLRHAKSLELRARLGHRVGHFTALNENADFARSRRFRRGNRPNDAMVLEFAEKFLCAHNTYQLDPAPPPPKLPPPPLKPLNRHRRPSCRRLTSHRRSRQIRRCKVRPTRYNRNRASPVRRSLDMMMKITMSKRMISPSGNPPPLPAFLFLAGATRAFVFAAHRLHHRGHARFQSARVVAFLKERRDNVVRDVEAGRVGQRALRRRSRSG